MNRDFKGVWIPKEIWLDKNLTLLEKCFFVEIDSLNNKEGCFASNKYFSEFFGISKGRSTQIIKSLELKEFLTIELERSGKQIVKRTLRVVNKLNRVVNKLNNPSEKIKHPYLENDEDNNTLNNNTNKEKNALTFLQSHKQLFETIEMQNRARFSDWDKMLEHFSYKVDEESLEYTTKILIARLMRWMNNWESNSSNKETDAERYHKSQNA